MFGNYYASSTLGVGQTFACLGGTGVAVVLSRASGRAVVGTGCKFFVAIDTPTVPKRVAGGGGAGGWG